MTWTPIETELPDDNTTVLLSLADHSEPVWPGYCEDGSWYLADGMPVDSVTAWQPLPEAYKRRRGPVRESRAHRTAKRIG